MQIQLTQELKPAVHGLGRLFFDWVLQNKVVDGDFWKISCLAMKHIFN